MLWVCRLFACLNVSKGVYCIWFVPFGRLASILFSVKNHSINSLVYLVKKNSKINQMMLELLQSKQIAVFHTTLITFTNNLTGMHRLMHLRSTKNSTAESTKTPDVARAWQRTWCHWHVRPGDGSKPASSANLPVPPLQPLHRFLSDAGIYIYGKYRFRVTSVTLGFNGIHHGIHHKAAWTRFDSQFQMISLGEFQAGAVSWPSCWHEVASGCQPPLGPNFPWMSMNASP